MNDFERLKQQYLAMRDEYKGIDTFKLVDAAFHKANMAQFDLIIRSNTNGTNKIKYNRALEEFQRAMNNFNKMINSTAPRKMSRRQRLFPLSINRTRALPTPPRVQGTLRTNRQSRQSQKTQQTKFNEFKRYVNGLHLENIPKSKRKTVRASVRSRRSPQTMNPMIRYHLSEF